MAGRTVKPKPEVDEVSELKKQLLEMQKMVAELSKSKTEETKQVAKPVIKKQLTTNQVKIDPPFGKFINVMSLTNHVLGLVTARVNGTEYHFNNIGEIQSIIYDDLAKIIHMNKTFAEGGKFYIMDENVVKLHNLTKHYEKFMTAEYITDILNFDLDAISELVSNTTDTIKETIVSVVFEKLMNDEKLDLNKVSLISELCGVDILDQIKKVKENMNN